MVCQCLRCRPLSGRFPWHSWLTSESCRCQGMHFDLVWQDWQELIRGLQPINVGIFFSHFSTGTWRICAIRNNWPSVNVIFQTNWGQQITRESGCAKLQGGAQSLYWSLQAITADVCAHGCLLPVEKKCWASNFTPRLAKGCLTIKGHDILNLR